MHEAPKPNLHILFDLDGTLTESEQGIINSVIYALGEMGIIENDREKLKKFIGPPLRESFMKYYGFDEAEAEKVVAHYRVNYKAKGIYEAPLYDGVKETLQALKDMGINLYLATAKPEIFANQILKYFEIDHLFTDVVGSCLDGTLGTKDEIIAFLLEKNNISDKSKTIMVGDREYDITGAKSAGSSSIGVLYGYGDYDELKNAGADHIIEKIEDILTYEKIRSIN